MSTESDTVGLDVEPAEKKPHMDKEGNSNTNDNDVMNKLTSEDRDGQAVQVKSKNARKKEARLARIKASREERRRRERSNRKIKKREDKHKDKDKDKDKEEEEGDRVSKKQRRMLELAKLREGLSDEGKAARVAIHLGFQDMMNEREMTSLAAQIRRAYGANRSACNAKVALWVLGLQPETKMHKVGCRNVLIVSQYVHHTLFISYRY